MTDYKSLHDLVLETQFTPEMAAQIMEDVARQVKRANTDMLRSISQALNTPRYQRVRAIEEHVAAECGRKTVREDLRFGVTTKANKQLPRSRRYDIMSVAH